MAKIVFDPNLAHVLGFRHGPRAANPPPYNLWDYWRMLSPEAPVIAARTVKTYFPGLVPAALRCSQIPRSPATLGFLWPDLVPKIQLERRLGFEFEDLAMWAPMDAHADAYFKTPQWGHELQPGLVDQCGENFFFAARDLAEDVGEGHVGVMCSHVPYADAGARYARRLLKLGADIDYWLPGDGFGSGAFVHLGFELNPDRELKPTKLVLCDYYPVPPEE